ncbi:hypothetical protein F4604DRAFT_1226106 [Suillus subluteus]|nr:hypothetical protein F4604DRAFT_1226106 [Suillus subluteus]
MVPANLQNKRKTSAYPLGKLRLQITNRLFHLFNKEKQSHLARTLAGLLSAQRGSVICGDQLGTLETDITLTVNIVGCEHHSFSPDLVIIDAIFVGRGSIREGHCKDRNRFSEGSASRGTVSHGGVVSVLWIGHLWTIYRPPPPMHNLLTIPSWRTKHRGQFESVHAHRFQRRWSII